LTIEVQTAHPFANRAKDGAPLVVGNASEIKSLGHPPLRASSCWTSLVFMQSAEKLFNIEREALSHNPNFAPLNWHLRGCAENCVIQLILLCPR
jgi:hypothetical protein